MRKIIFYIILVASVALSSCQKDLDLFVPDPITGFDSTWYNTLNNTMPAAGLNTTLLLPAYTDSFDLNTSTVTLTTGSGLQCMFTAGSILNPANSPVTGKIYLETHLLKKKGDILRMGTPTISDGRLLVSGGEFFIRLTKDGNELHLAQNGHVYIHYNDSPVSYLMNLFNGEETNPAGFNWLPNMDTVNNRVFPLNQSTYEILTNRLHWINCDYFYDTTGIPQTIVSASLPANYTNANSIAYTVFNDMRSVIGMYGNATTRKFSSGKLPANKIITVVIISKQGNDYYLGHELVTTIGSSGAVNNQQVIVTPVITSLDNIKAYLNSL